MPTNERQIELLTNFVLLADAGSYRAAANQTKKARSTIKRRKEELEQLTGQQLFEETLDGQGLTDSGRRLYSTVAPKTDALAALTDGQDSLFENRQVKDIVLPDNRRYAQVELPLDSLWTRRTKALSNALQGWVQAQGKLATPILRTVAESGVVYRKNQEDWSTILVGPKSFFAKWYGIDHAHAALGLNIRDMPFGHTVGEIMAADFTRTQTVASVQLHQIFAGSFDLSKAPKTNLEYVRLLMRCTMADQSPVVLSVVDKVEDRNIPPVANVPLSPGLDKVVVRIPSTNQK